MIEKYNYTCFLTSILAVSLNWAVPMAKANNEGPAVQWVGTLRNVHHGIDYSGHIDLRSLANVNHLYADVTINSSVPTPTLSERSRPVKSFFAEQRYDATRITPRVFRSSRSVHRGRPGRTDHGRYRCARRTVSWW